MIINENIIILIDKVACFNSHYPTDSDIASRHAVGFCRLFIFVSRTFVEYLFLKDYAKILLYRIGACENDRMSFVDAWIEG